MNGLKHWSIWFLVMLVVCLSAGCDLKHRHERTVELPLEIVEGNVLNVRSHVGSIKVDSKNDHAYQVHAKIIGKGNTQEKAKAVAEAIEISVAHNNDTVKIKIDKPLSIKNDWFHVDFTIFTPRAIHLDCKTNVGDITTEMVEGDISAITNVGTINSKNTAGKVVLKADVGDIYHVYNDNPNKTVDVQLRTNVGNITIDVPENLSANVNATTGVGSIHSNLPISVTGDICTKKLSGTIGSGAGSIQMKTDVGSIHIK